MAKVIVALSLITAFQGNERIDIPAGAALSDYKLPKDHVARYVRLGLAGEATPTVAETSTKETSRLQTAITAETARADTAEADVIKLRATLDKLRTKDEAGVKAAEAEIEAELTAAAEAAAKADKGGK